MGNGKGAPAGMTSMDEILNFQQHMRVTWAEFRRMIAAEIYAESREEE